jgi:hypothetical protein
VQGHHLSVNVLDQSLELQELAGQQQETVFEYRFDFQPVVSSWVFGQMVLLVSYSLVA